MLYVFWRWQKTSIHQLYRWWGFKILLDVVAHDPYHGKEVKNLECIFVGQSTLEMGVASPVINFNHGQSGILKLMENLSMNPGEYLIRYCKERDNTGIK